MRNRRIPRSLGACLLTLAALALPACEGDGVVVPQTEEPFLYLVLNLRSVAMAYSSDSGQHALLLTSGSPLESPLYRSAERFEMRRLSDGARFDWRRYPNLVSEPGTLHGISLDYANYYLPEAATAAGLGTADLRPGESYELEILTAGTLIRGSVTAPGPFSVAVRTVGEHRWLVWRRVHAAGGYLLSFSDGRTALQQDTAYLLGERAQYYGGEIVIHALDENLYHYVADPQVARAGIDAGLGVFGATSAVLLREGFLNPDLQTLPQR